MGRTSAEVAVLGAGLTGACTALELARLGYDVLLIERDERAMNRASLRNEGKIHLGLIYANDSTMATAHLQLRGALRFRHLLKRWLGRAVDGIPVSTPFTYLVARDSVLSPDELTLHYERIQSQYDAELREDPTLDYLGGRPERLYAPIPGKAFPRCFTQDHFAAAFETAELAIDTADLARMIRSAIAAHPRITFRPGRNVVDLDDAGPFLRVSGTSEAGTWSVDAQHVVNATWENRLRLDRRLGLDIPEGWLHRLKYRIIARLPDALRGAASATMVTGRYGDVVVRPDGTAYLSWYPVGLQGWTHDIAPPASWDGPCRGEVPSRTCDGLARQFFDNIDRWFPGIGKCEPLLIDAGAIVAYGRTDVDDRDSGLHDRTRVGVTSAGRYHSIDPGKMTTAPYFAKIAAERIHEAVRPAVASARRSVVV